MHIHLVMVPDDGNFKKLNDPCHPAKTPRRRKEARLAQKPPHRPPSHRTSTKPSGGRVATGATRHAKSEKSETMSWRILIPHEDKVDVVTPCNKLF